MPLPRHAPIAVLLCVACLSSGCRMFRAEAGMGVGLGADVKLPGLVHTGLGVGDFQNVGVHYGRKSHKEREAFANLLFWHWEGNLREPMSTHHACAGLFPPLTTYQRDEHDVDQWSFEIGLALGLWAFRLGFNPMGGQGERDEKDSEKGDDVRIQPAQ